MYKCFICQAVHKTCQSLVSHLRMDHSFYPSSRFKLVCAQDRYRRQFLSYSGFKKHLNSVHERIYVKVVMQQTLSHFYLFVTVSKVLHMLLKQMSHMA